MMIKLRKGFTFIEVLVVVSMLGVIMVSLTQLLAGMLSGTSKTTALQLVKENGQFAIHTIGRTVRRARIVSVCDNGSVTVIVPEEGGRTTYQFRHEGTQILRTESAGGTDVPLLDAGVEAASFSCTQTVGTPTTPAIVALSITLRKPSLFLDDAAVTQTFQTSVSLRSY